MVRSLSDAALYSITQRLQLATLLLERGKVLVKMGDQGQGVVNLQYVVYEHPGTREADLAREQLRSLGLTIR